MYKWKKDIVSWKIGNITYLSIPFTWLLPKAKKIIEITKGKIIIGGGAVKLLPDYLSKKAIISDESPINPLHFHNPCATFTTRGCPNKCKYCAVPVIEGNFKELKTWEIKPVICDNNLLASSKKYFNKVIDSLKTLPFIDFNQGLDINYLKSYHLDKISELKSVKLRFAFDHIRYESKVIDVINLCKRKGFKNINIYVLIGYDDTPDEAIYKLEKIKSMEIFPNPMRFQPLDCLQKDNYVNKNWTQEKLQNIMRYYSRQIWLSHIKFDNYKGKIEKETLF